MNFFKQYHASFDYGKFTSNLQAIRQTDSKATNTSANANEKMYALYGELYEALRKATDGLREGDVKDSEAQELVGHFTMLISLAHVNYLKNSKGAIGNAGPSSSPASTPYNLQNAYKLTLDYMMRSETLARSLSFSKLPILKRLCLAPVCLDIENETYPSNSGDGKQDRVQEYAYQLTAGILRENISLDVSELLGTQDEEILQEVVERMQKYEMKQVWDILYRSKEAIQRRPDS